MAESGNIVNRIGVPELMTSFLGDERISEVSVRNMAMAGYEVPTTLQKYIIPAVLAKRDLMVYTKVEAGKIAAYAIPILDKIYEQTLHRNLKSSVLYCKQKPLGLVLVPDNKSAKEIYREIKKYIYNPVSIYIAEEIVRALTDGVKNKFLNFRVACQFLVATPENLIDLMERGLISLQDCQYLVLDKIDSMIETGLESQIRTILKNDGIPKTGERQTVMFSATYPARIQRLSWEFLQNQILLTIHREDLVCENITQNIFWADGNDKLFQLLEVLGDNNNSDYISLVFVETKKGAEDLKELLTQNGIAAMSIHGKKTQLQRRNILDDLYSGNCCSVVVATAIAAKGIVVPNVKEVINYDFPTNIEEYIRRSKLMGHENGGLYTSFFCSESRYLKEATIRVLMDSNQNVPNFLRRL